MTGIIIRATILSFASKPIQKHISTIVIRVYELQKKIEFQEKNKLQEEEINLQKRGKYL